MAIKQYNTVNILREPSCTNHDLEGEKQKNFYVRFSKHFELVQVGFQRHGCQGIAYFVPRIHLFLDETARNMYLDYTVNSTSASVMRMRELLLDTENLGKRINALVNKMQAECQRLKLPAYELRTLTFLPDNASKDGERVTYRIAIDGSKSNNPNVYDLSNYSETKTKNNR